MHDVWLTGKNRAVIFKKLESYAPEYPDVLVGHFEADFGIVAYGGNKVPIEKWLKSDETEALIKINGRVMWLTKAGA